MIRECCTCIRTFPFQSQVTFHYINSQHFVYPFICHCIRELPPFLAAMKNAKNIWVQVYVQACVFISLGQTPGVELPLRNGVFEERHFSTGISSTGRVQR